MAPLRSIQGRWTHVLCSMLLPSANQDEDTSLLHCPCGQNSPLHAVVSCSFAACAFTSHPMCAMQKGSKIIVKDGIQKSFHLLCPKHSSASSGKRNRSMVQNQENISSIRQPKRHKTNLIKAVTHGDLQPVLDPMKRGSIELLKALELCCVSDPILLSQFHESILLFADGPLDGFPLQPDKFPAQFRDKLWLISSQMHANSHSQYCWAPSHCAECDQDSKFLTICHLCRGTKAIVDGYSSSRIRTALQDSSKINAAIVRGLDYVRKSCKSLRKGDFDNCIGDLLFLFRFVVIYSPPGSEVHRAAVQLVNDVGGAWDARHPILGSEASGREILVFTESVHAKQDTHLDGLHLVSLKDQVSSAMCDVSHEDLVDFDPTVKHADELPRAEKHICSHCGKVNRKTAEVCLKCKRKLVSVLHYQSICHAIVWAGVFSDIGLEFRAKSNWKTCVDDILCRLRDIRPYKSLEALGEMAFKEQCYFVTHLLLSVTSWGRYHVEVMDFIPEYLFILGNLNVVIKLGDPELAGEFLQSLRIMGIPKTAYPIERGISYLLNKERSLKAKGYWIAPQKADFYQMYHSVYCAIIGMMDYSTPPGVAKTMPDKWKEIITSQNKQS
jgi:hypothetical protein